MRFKEFLLEMAIKIAEIDTGKRKLGIQITTGNMGGFQAGITEHYPAHIHVISIGLDMPIPIDNSDIKPKERIVGNLSLEEKAYVQDFLDYYGRDNLKKIFDAAFRTQDPEPLFKQLKIRKDEEWSKNSETPKSFNGKKIRW